MNAGLLSASNPRPVSRGLKIHNCFTGIDSLYLVLEYPYKDVFDLWSAPVSDNSDPMLYDGIPFRGMVLKRGGIGYKLSVWDGDARLFITDRVEETLVGTAAEGQGMGVMLQLGPKWLRLCSEGSIEQLKHYIEAQFDLFGIQNSHQYPCRINRIDIAIDIQGLDTANFSVDEWREQWVGYASQKTFHDSPQTAKLEGLSIGSAKGAVRFKVYDKLQESMKLGNFGFWTSVWSLDKNIEISIARFEWTIKCYHARFTNLRYLNQLTHNGIFELLNYVSLKWGRLCIPESDTNKSRWSLSPLWENIRTFVKNWSENHHAIASREYDLTPDIKPEYMRSLAGWIAGLEARLGVQLGYDNAASLFESLKYLKDKGFSPREISHRASKKHQILSTLAGNKKRYEQ